MTTSTPLAVPTKPRLTVLVGAGASYDLGVPLTDPLTAIVRSRFENPAPGFANYFRDPKDPDRRRQLFAAAEQHYGDKLNFEQLFEFLESGLALHSGWRGRGGIAESGWTQPRSDLLELFKGRDGYAEFLSHSRLMLELTVGEVISAASAAAPNQEAWPLFRSFWSGLASSFDLTVATLNYDTLIEQALGWGGAEQGFEAADGSFGWLFHPRLVHQRQEHRLLHLHGSTLFKGMAYGDTAGIWNAASGHWENKWFPTAEAAGRASGGDLGRTAYGRELLGGSIITGLHKTDKVAAEPYMTYYEATANELRSSPRLLVVGYGFNDPHINRLVRRMTRDHGDSRRVACVDYVRLPDEIQCNLRGGFLEAMHLWCGRALPWNEGPSASWVDMDGLWNAPGGTTQLHFNVTVPVRT
jgi:hypothetical protein